MLKLNQFSLLSNLIIIFLVISFGFTAYACANIPVNGGGGNNDYCKNSSVKDCDSSSTSELSSASTTTNSSDEISSSSNFSSQQSLVSPVTSSVSSSSDQSSSNGETSSSDSSQSSQQSSTSSVSSSSNQSSSNDQGFLCTADNTEYKWDWVETAGTAGVNRADGNAVDSQGNLYIIGSYVRTINLQGIVLNSSPNTGDDRLDREQFIAKYTPDGQVVWAKSVETTLSRNFTNIVIDNRDNIYIAGYFRESINFGTISITSPLENGRVRSDNRLFIARYDTNGNVQWAVASNLTAERQIGIPSTHALKTDNLGNIYLGGRHTASIRFGSIRLSTSADLSSSPFIFKFNSQGNPIWGKSAVTSGVIDSSTQDIAVDSRNNVYVYGSFGQGTINFEGNALTSRGSGDAFLLKYSQNGVLLWAKSLGGTGADYSQTLRIDQLDNVYVSLVYQSSARVDNVIVRSSVSARLQSLIAKYNSRGVLQWAQNVSAVRQEDNLEDFVIVGNNIIGVGYFANWVTLNNRLNRNTPNLANTFTRQSLFLAKLDLDGNRICAIGDQFQLNESNSAARISVNNNNIFISGAFMQPSNAQNISIRPNANRDIFFGKMSFSVAD
jgi:hypothetical protein